MDFFYKGRVGPSPHFFVSFITIELPDILHTLGGMGGIKESVEKNPHFSFFSRLPLDINNVITIREGLNIFFLEPPSLIHPEMQKKLTGVMYNFVQ